MIEINPIRFKTRPFKHQLEGVKAFIRFDTFALFDEMRLGKSKQVIDAACLLHEDRRLELVVIVAPASVRGVWTNADDPVGEIKKHAWVPSVVREFHARGLKTTWGDKLAENGRRLEWWVTNYEFIRQLERRRELELAIAHHDVDRGHKTWIVLDESSFIKSHRSRQAKACLALRRRFARASILNGTPWSHSPLDLYAQMLFLSPRILGFRNFWEFRYRYAVMGGWMNKQVIKYQNLEELTGLIRPWCLRRRLEDVFDMPEPVESFREIALAATTWAHYKTVRDELIAWLDAATPVIIASTAAVRVLRLAQLTSGFLGGIDVDDAHADGRQYRDRAPLKVGNEKMNATLEVLEDASANDRPVIVWCRFRAERERFAVEARKRGWPTYEIHGGQKRADRNEARAAFTHDSTVKGFRVLFGQPQAGGFGLDLAAGAVVVYASSDFNALTRWQSEARAKHPAKTAPIEYVDVLATGPKGQRTVDHLIRRVLKSREDLAAWTSARWRRELTDE